MVWLISETPATKIISLGCAPCPAGYGVIIRCSIKEDTVCQRCDDDEWTPAEHHMKECRCIGFTQYTFHLHHHCSKCSRCGEDMYVKRACSAHSDTFCDSCDNVNPSINDDFVKKCLDKRSAYGCCIGCAILIKSTFSRERAEAYAVRDTRHTIDSSIEDDWQHALDNAEAIDRHAMDQIWVRRVKQTELTRCS